MLRRSWLLLVLSCPSLYDRRCGKFFGCDSGEGNKDCVADTDTLRI